MSLLAVLSAAVLSGGCSTTGSAPTSTSRVDRTPVQVPAPAPALRQLAVTMTQQALVDTTRPVTSDGRELADQRALPTVVWTPTGPGPFPLVVFVHGFGKGPSDYQRFCSQLASSGYVVAAPSFPLEDPARGFPLDRSHLTEEAGDVSFVITAIEGEPGGHIDDTRVAVVGHSDGADVALLVGYGTGTADPRVGAVVADAPDPMGETPAPSHVPLLLIQGTADSVVPYSSSQTVFEQVDAPVFYLSLLGADHLPPIAGGTPWTPVLDESTAAFLDATVAGRGPGDTALAGELSSSPLVRFASKE